MLKEFIRAHSDAGEGCLQVILRAAAEEYGMDLPETTLP